MLVEDVDGWTMLDGERRIEQITLDFRLSLRMDDGSEIIIETSFELAIDGRRLTVDPGTKRNLADAIALLHRDVAEIRATRLGDLHVVFVDGTQIDVPPHRRFENWQVVLPHEALLVGLPAGDVAVFPSSS